MEVWLKYHSNDTTEQAKIPQNLRCKSYQISKLKCLSSRHATVFARSIEARCYVKNEVVVGAGSTPTTFEWETISLPTKWSLISNIWRYPNHPRNYFSTQRAIAPNILFSRTSITWMGMSFVKNTPKLFFLKFVSITTNMNANTGLVFATTSLTWFFIPF